MTLSAVESELACTNPGATTLGVSNPSRVGSGVGLSRSIPQTGSPITVLDTRVLSGSGGGPDKTIINSPRFLTPVGYRMLCAYLHAPDDPGFQKLRGKAEAVGTDLISIADRGPLDLSVVFELLRLCRRERVTIWHGHDYKTNALGVLLRPFWPMKLVTTVHGWVTQTTRTPLYYAIDRLSLRAYERVICVSQDLFDTCKSLGISDDRCALVDNAIDTVQFSRRRTTKEAKRQLGIDPERLTIGAVGRLSQEKGFDLLIRSLDQLLQRQHDVELVIVGEGDERAALEQLAATLGRSDRVRFLGYRPDIAEVYEAMDVFALSSLREGLPNVVLEAMALEVPVVATRIGGVPLLVRDKENGLLVESGDLHGLTNALSALVLEPQSRARLARSGRQCVENDFSFARRMQKIQVIYDDLLGICR
jgi:glycosyltransferase involved in cell wall biosynthesis